MRRTIAGLVVTAAGLIGAGVLSAAPAHARPVYPLQIDIVSVTQTKAKVSITCPNDPPARVYIIGTVAGVQQQLAFSEPFRCTGRAQTVQLSLFSRLARGTVVSDAFATFSGDSGEIVQVDHETLVVR
jgi:hypothetical protein